MSLCVLGPAEKLELRGVIDKAYASLVEDCWLELRHRCFFRRISRNCSCSQFLGRAVGGGSKFFIGQVSTAVCHYIGPFFLDQEHSLMGAIVSLSLRTL